MKKFLSAFLFLISVGAAVDARADGFGGSGFIQLKVGQSTPPPPPTNVPVVVSGALPEIVPSATSAAAGLDVVGSTLAMNPGSWTNSPTSYTCSWHMIGGSSLGTNCNLFGPLTSAMVTACSGSTDPACGRLEVDVVAHNTAGASATVISDFIGPVEAALPLKPFMIIGTGLATSTVTIGGVASTITSQTATNIQGLIPRTAPDPIASNTVVSAGTITTVGYGAMNAPTALPIYPANFLQATPVSGVIGVQHAIAPGCFVFPAAPNLASGHVFYFDPINGTTQGAGATGAASPASAAFNNIQAIFQTGQSGYTGMLWNTVIHAGDTIYIRHGDVSHPLGILTVNGIYSTSTGTTSGSIVPTWIAPDPADPTTPVLIELIANSSAGVLFSGFHVESNALDFGTWGNQALSMVSTGGSSSAPAHDLVFEHLSLDGWKGNSGNLFNPTYPNANGHSDGTIQTAGPYMGATENLQSLSGTAALHATKIFMNSTMPSTALKNIYVWSKDYYFQNADKSNFPTAPVNTGIPNGTKVIDLQGLPNLSFQGNIATSASLPGTVTNNNAWFANNTLHLWVGVSGIWTDEGLAFIDIGTCNPVTDAATGCPSTNTPNATPFVGCSPLVLGQSGGCNNNDGTPGWGAAPVWNGATRAITAELLDFTPAMVVTPSGYWNNIDWDYTNQGIAISGQYGTNNLDPANINDVTGSNCISLNHNIVRDIYNGLAIDLTANDVVNNLIIDYRAQDAIEMFSSHRVIKSYVFVGDATFQRGHPDIDQWATVGGTNVTEASTFYNNSDVNIEGYTFVDPGDFFPDFTQPIGQTDGIWSGSYLGNDIIFNSDNPLAIAGTFNVLVQSVGSNDNSFNAASGIKYNAGNKANTSNPANSLMANNIASAEGRPQIFPFTLSGTGFGATQGTGTVVINTTTIPTSYMLSWAPTLITGIIPFGTPVPTTGNTVVTANGGGATTLTSAGLLSPTPCVAGASTVEGNVQIPQMDYGSGFIHVGNSTICGLPDISTGVINGTLTGIYNDINSWNATDYRTEISGVTSPFMGFHPLPPTGVGILASAAPSPCMQNEWVTGSCPTSGVLGIMNLRPNPSFVSTILAGLTTVSDLNSLPQPGTVGASYIVANASFCSVGVSICGTALQFGGQSYPAGIYKRTATGTTMAAFGSTPASPGPWASGVIPFVPPIIGAGVDLGIQGTPANHGRQSWGGVWNAGAY